MRRTRRPLAGRLRAPRSADAKTPQMKEADSMDQFTSLSERQRAAPPRAIPAVFAHPAVLAKPSTAQDLSSGTTAIVPWLPLDPKGERARALVHPPRRAVRYCRDTPRRGLEKLSCEQRLVCRKREAAHIQFRKHGNPAVAVDVPNGAPKARCLGTVHQHSPKAVSRAKFSRMSIFSQNVVSNVSRFAPAASSAWPG